MKMFKLLPIAISGIAALIGLRSGWLLNANAAKLLPTKAILPNSALAGLPTAKAVGEVTSAESRAPNLSRIDHWFALATAAASEGAREFPRLFASCGGEIAAQRMIAAQWIQRHPQSLWQWLCARDAIGHGMTHEELTDLLLGEWPSMDPQAAFDTVAATMNFPNLHQIRSQVISQLWRTRPELALKATEEWELGHASSFRPAMDAWVEADPQRAAEASRKLPGNKAMDLLRSAGSAWGRSDPKAALAYAATLPPEEERSMLDCVLSAWVKQDAAAALAHCASLPDSAVRGLLGVNLVNDWAKKEPAKAMAWGLQHLKGRFRNMVAGAVVATLAQEEISNAVSQVEQLDAGPAKHYATGILMKTWARSNPTAAAHWLLQLPAEDAATREDMFMNLAQSWPPEKINEAAALMTGPNAKEVPKKFTNYILLTESHLDPASTLKWIEDLPPDQVSGARSSTFTSWLQMQPDHALAWLAERPKDTIRQALVSTAMQSLSEGKIAQRAEFILTRMPAEDRPLAAQLLQKSALPAELKEKYGKWLNLDAGPK